MKLSRVLSGNLATFAIGPVQKKTLLVELFLESDRMSDDHATASRPLAAILVVFGISRKALTEFAFCDIHWSFWHLDGSPAFFLDQ